MPVEIKIPLINPNEPEAHLASVYVVEGQRVGPGEPLCSLETTKSTQDFESPASGYIAGLRLHAGESVRAGETFCYLAEDPEWKPVVDDPVETPALPAGLRISDKARLLVQQHSIDITKLPRDRFITESDLLALVQMASDDHFKLQAPFDASSIIVYGGGGHGKMVIDVLRGMHSFTIKGVVDDGRKPGETVMGVPVLGGKADLPRLLEEGTRLAVNAVGGIGNIQVRINIFRTLAEAGFSFPVIVHPSAHIDGSAVLSQGAQVFTHAYVGSEARLGFGVIANTGAIISHDCQIGDFTNISPGAVLAGNVTTGKGTLIGMGVTVNLGVKIGQGAKIGNSATIKADVPDGAVVRAGTVWPER